jgi:hypothetical protein
MLSVPYVDHHAVIRGRLWRAFARDDPDEMMSAIEDGAKKEKKSTHAFVRNMDDFLWHSEETGLVDPSRKSIFVAVATSAVGVPKETGAVMCLARLLAEFPPDVGSADPLHVRFSSAQAATMGRLDVVDLLDRYCEQEATDVILPTTSLFCPDTLGPLWSAYLTRKFPGAAPIIRAAARDAAGRGGSFRVKAGTGSAVRRGDGVSGVPRVPGDVYGQSFSVRRGAPSMRQVHWRSEPQMPRVSRSPERGHSE